ncbi:MAG: CBS domain-containing protein [Candidatus Electrothrix aestuarii]|jgi:CBS domain-containing protein|uniref:CBS domain-containing protein n=1 Tax=Candidatus Electrothrix aestuarii TaxID=3062594 RepID=A0AAU8LVC7_9BACT|nr:CBS domain-containing protein [Candidatus Electrothrix aestuarii]
MPERCKDIREMITPLDRCLSVYQHQTLDEAIALFSEFLTEAHPVELPVLLVLDEQDRLVGTLSRLDILRGLVPSMLGRCKCKGLFTSKAEYHHLTYLYEDHALSECGGNRTRQVRSQMRPVDFTLPADTHILEAIVLLHNHHTTCIPVSEDGAVIGLLRFEELFHTMCNTWCTLPQGQNISSQAEKK